MKQMYSVKIAVRQLLGDMELQIVLQKSILENLFVNKKQSYHVEVII